MIVTSRTGERQAEKRSADRFDPLFPFLGDDLLDDVVIELQFFPIAGAQPKEAERRHVVRFNRHAIGVRVFGESFIRVSTHAVGVGVKRMICLQHQIRSELLADEVIERHILIHRPDDPITIEPRLSLAGAPRFADVAIPCEVEPHPRPAFAESRIGQQSFDQSLVSIWRLIGDEPLNLIGCWWKTKQVKRDSSN